ncbi:MAG: DUF1294 domain-containing protein [Ruminococcus sp.]|nr:DUF1294 domain-containing protein [Ruminococcus sp.]
MNNIIIIFIVYTIIINIITLVQYYRDKKKAKNNQWRIKESTLLFLGIFGGSIGAVAGMKKFHHKTKKWYFWAVNITGIFLDLIVFILILKYQN